MNMEQELAALRAENEALKADKAKSQPSGGLKISEKGALSVYGLGRFPVTLYKSQWITLLGKAKEIAEFVKANESKLKDKADPKA